MGDRPEQRAAVSMSQTHHSLPVFQFLFRRQIVWLWIAGSILTWIQMEQVAGSIGALLAGGVFLLFLLSTLGYGLDIIESTARGVAEPPRFRESLRANDIRLWRLGGALCVGLAILDLTPETYRDVPFLVMLALSPAVVSATTFHEPLTSSLSPIRIWQFISSMGLTYWSLRIMTNSVLLLSLFVAEGRLQILSTTAGHVFVSVFMSGLVLLMFRATGALLHARRSELGIRTLFSEEQSTNSDRQARVGELRDSLMTINKALRSEGFERAWSSLERLLKQRAYKDEPEIYDLLKEFSDRRLLQRVGSGYIAHLLETDPARALSIFDERWQESSGGFRGHSGALLLSLSAIADTHPRKTAIFQMLSEFDQLFPAHPGRLEAAIRAAEIAIDLGRYDEARAQCTVAYRYGADRSLNRLVRVEDLLRTQ